MNQIPRRLDIVADRAPRVQLPDAIVLGMPQLSANGLSESWLLKELGHRHWVKLGESAGMNVPDFRDDAGNPVYAAFCVISIADADFGTVRENDTLHLSSSISRLSHTQVASRHCLTIGGRAIGTVEMVSTFVRRGTEGGNHAVARVVIDGLPPVAIRSDRNGLAGLAARFRADRIAEHMGFDLRATREIASHAFDPCPSQDFNGAGFLYFSSFLAFVDRAEWQFARAVAMTATTRRRDIIFRGNVDRGETLRVLLAGSRSTDREAIHHCRLYRGSDNALVADVFSVRQALPS